MQRLLRVWALPAGLALAAVALQALGLGHGLRFERTALAAGQWWLAATGQLVHLGWAHLGANLAGLALIGWFSDPRQGLGYALSALGASAGAVAAGLYWLNPELQWYVGLSGLEHGLLLAVLLWPGRPPARPEWLIAGVILAKIAYEQWQGPSPLTAGWVGGAVVVDAHLYGAAGGLGVAAARFLTGRICRGL